MFEYKSEAVKIPLKFFKASLNETEIAKLDEVINCVLLTFRKEK